MFDDEVYKYLIILIRENWKRKKIKKLTNSKNLSMTDLLLFCETNGFPNIDIALKMLNITFDTSKFNEQELLIYNLLFPAVTILSYSIKQRDQTTTQLIKTPSQITLSYTHFIIETKKITVSFEYRIEFNMFVPIHKQLSATKYYSTKIVDIIMLLTFTMKDISEYFISLSPVLIFLPSEMAVNKITSFNTNIEIANKMSVLQISEKLKHNIKYTTKLFDYLCVLRQSKHNILEIFNCLTLQEKIKIDKLNFGFQISFEQNPQNIDNDEKKLLKDKIISHNIPDYVKNILIEKIKQPLLNEKRLLYINTLLKFPWNYKTKKNNIIVSDVENKLNKKIYGHTRGKQLISEFLHMYNLSQEKTSFSIGLNGPPGIGKTTFVKALKKSIANSELITINLSGHSDGSIIKGNNYLYKGSTPGLIIQKMCEVNKKTSCVIIYFDELDKLSYRNGLNEIENILIALTDKTVSKFNDNFFQGIDFPLYNILFIFSYNNKTNINPILLSRIYEIKLSGLSISEKMNIIKTFTIPEICNRFNFPDENLISDSLLKKIIIEYTNEKGVRLINKLLERIFINAKQTNNKIVNIDKILGIPVFKQNVEYPYGTCPMIYVSEYYTDGITVIQTYPTIDSSDIFTYNLSQIFRETIYISKQVAYNYLLSKKIIDEKVNFKFHYNIPESTSIKDGDSSACAIFISLVSYFLKKPIKNYTLPIGALDICGNILNVGDLHEKIISAIDIGFTNIYIPNVVDKNVVSNNNNNYCESAKIIPVKNVDELVKLFFY